jgi:hypothetical protein
MEALKSSRNTHRAIGNLLPHTQQPAAINNFSAARQASSQGQNPVSRLKVCGAQLPANAPARLASPSPLRHRVVIQHRARKA